MKQSPVWLGRKKREIEDEPDENTLESGGQDSDLFEEEEIEKPVSELIELTFNGETKKFAVVNEITVKVDGEPPEVPAVLQGKATRPRQPRAAWLASLYVPLFS